MFTVRSYSSGNLMFIVKLFASEWNIDARGVFAVLLPPPHRGRRASGGILSERAQSGPAALTGGLGAVGTQHPRASCRSAAQDQRSHLFSFHPAGAYFYCTSTLCRPGAL